MSAVPRAHYEGFDAHGANLSERLARARVAERPQGLELTSEARSKADATPLSPQSIRHSGSSAAVRRRGWHRQISACLVTMQMSS
jgi:hypothetical protein